ncbi:hypothetical protein [Flavobacterium sp.]|uniref:hypothetical protein n=1 Tax=Flavobacterium sp. TaxID=239 RepID=UPI002619672F|nr:hypothetical protein [Flavobacterium sp.]
MKLFYTTFLLCITVCCFSQENILSSYFDNIGYVDDLKMYGEEIYCSGYSFDTTIDDGNASDAYLVKYDKNTLKPQWTLKVSDEPSNRINAVIKMKDRIYALVTQGTIQINSEDIYLSLFTITLNGEIEQRQRIGASVLNPSNFTSDGDNLFFGYQTKTATTYGGQDVRSVIVKYNLENKTFYGLESCGYQPRAKKLLLHQSDVYLSGIYIHPDQQNFVCLKGKSLSEVSLKAKKTEYFLDSYFAGNTLTIVCVFPGVYGDLQKYLRYYYVNTDTNAITSKTTSYQDMGWSDVRFDTFSDGVTTWLIVEEMESKQLKYVQLDNTGKILKTLPFGEGNGHRENFIVTNDVLINASKGSIRVTRL